MMEHKRIYLAAPYSDNDRRTMIRRFRQVTTLANRMTLQGYQVFSPVTHGHMIKAFGNVPHGFDFWREFDLSFLQTWAEAICVFRLTKWDQSIGVQAELAEAKRLGLPVYFADVNIGQAPDSLEWVVTFERVS